LHDVVVRKESGSIVTRSLETVLKFKAGQRRGILVLAKAARSAHPRSGLTACAQRTSIRDN
jgi:hypothetical protein